MSLHLPQSLIHESDNNTYYQTVGKTTKGTFSFSNSKFTPIAFVVIVVNLTLAVET